MKTILLSTTSGWNCGDDWIRRGLLRALEPEIHRPEIRILWWNRGYGIEPTYGNSLDVNLPHVDYIIMAGTPEWIDKNEDVLWWALEHEIPISFLGVGRTGGKVDRHNELVFELAGSGLVEVAIPRDEIAQGLLHDWGFGEVTTEPMCDPAMFIPGFPTDFGGSNKVSIVTWRGHGRTGGRENYELPSGGSRKDVNVLLRKVYEMLPDPKRIVVHDNREIGPAAEWFGTDEIYYSSDPDRLFRLYADCRYYVGTRIHGWVAAMRHGAPGYLVYVSPKAKTVETMIQRMGLQKSAFVEYMNDRDLSSPEKILSLQKPESIGEKSYKERVAFRRTCFQAEKLVDILQWAAIT